MQNVQGVAERTVVFEITKGTHSMLKPIMTDRDCSCYHFQNRFIGGMNKLVRLRSVLIYCTKLHVPVNIF